MGQKTFLSQLLSLFACNLISDSIYDTSLYYWEIRPASSMKGLSYLKYKKFLLYGGIMDKVKQIEREMMRMDLPHFAPGDTVKVHVKENTTPYIREALI